MQAVWALGNIAGDSPQCRNLVLQAGALPPLLEQLGDNQKVSMQRNATWTLSNFCRGKPPPDFSVVSTGALASWAGLGVGMLVMRTVDLHASSMHAVRVPMRS